MVVKPKVRGFICTSAHPTGCAANIQQQIEYVKSKGQINPDVKNVLVVGASTGYGMASRISAAFGCGAKTLGIFFEKPGTERKPGTAGWYNSAAFQAAADAEGIWSKNINGDAFSNEIKEKACDVIADEMGKIDLIVYSLASPRRTDPNTGETFSSVLKPVGANHSAKTFNTSTNTIENIDLEAASEQEIQNTIKVMGGEDWEMWIDMLKARDLLSENCMTTAYTYIGAEITWPIYGKATIGAAKADLDRASTAINASLADLSGSSFVCSLRALVTQASSAIPIMPLYLSVLGPILSARSQDEGCIEQIERLFRDEMYGERKNLDSDNRLRVDDYELASDVQEKVTEYWDQINTENFNEFADPESYKKSFLQLFGFEIDGVDYEADVALDTKINNLL